MFPEMPARKKAAPVHAGVWEAWEGGRCVTSAMPLVEAISEEVGELV